MGDRLDILFTLLCLFMAHSQAGPDLLRLRHSRHEYP